MKLHSDAKEVILEMERLGVNLANGDWEHLKSFVDAAVRHAAKTGVSFKAAEAPAGQDGAELVKHAEWIASHYRMMAEKQTTPADKEMKAFYLGQVNAAESMTAFARSELNVAAPAAPSERGDAWKKDIPWNPEIERVRKEMMKRFSDKLSMEEIASFAYETFGAGLSSQEGK